MADRQVTRTGKGSDGDITKLCHPGKYWSPVSKAAAIRQIEGNIHNYYVSVDGQRVEITVVDPRDGDKYLRTDPDETEKNNLLELPDC